MNLWFRPILYSLLFFIWASAFVYIKMNTTTIQQDIAVIIMGLLNISFLGFCFQKYQVYLKSSEKEKSIKMLFNKFKSVIEAGVYDENGDVIWSSKKRNHENDLVRFLKNNMEPTSDLESFLNLYVRKKNCSAIVMSNRDGLRENGSWYFLNALKGENNSYNIFFINLGGFFNDYDKVKKSLKKMESFIDESPVGVIYLSPKNYIKGMNSTISNWIGISKKKLLGEPFGNFLFKNNEIKEGTQNVNILKKNGECINTIIQSPDKENFYKDPHFIFNLSNLSKKSSFKNDLFFQNSPIPSIILSIDGCISEINPSFFTFMNDINNSKVDHIGKNFIDFTASKYHYEIQSTIESIAKTKNSVAFDVQFLSEKASATAYASYININNPCILIQLVDKSELKNIESQFIQSQKMQAIGQLAGGIAHDFNNLLTAMIGFCDLLLQRYMPSEESYADVIQIKQNAVRAANLVSQLLTFSRKQSLNPESLDVSDRISQINFLLKRLIDSDISLEIHHGDNLSNIYAEPNQFEQIIINLVINARDAIKEKKGNLADNSIKISAFNKYITQPVPVNGDIIPNGDYVCICVSDTGTGISKENINKIFEPFFSTKDVGEGTGLGLSTVYGIVRQTNGFIIVENNSDNNSELCGTTFKILFPCHKNDKTFIDLKNSNKNNAENMEYLADLTGTDKILIVEDEVAVRKFSVRALKEKGYNVFEASCGEDAIKIIESEKESPFDLIISDVVMPKMDGPTLINKIHKIHPDIKVIFVSGYTEDTFSQNLNETSKIHFLPKPFSLKELGYKVKEVLVS